MKLAWSLKKKLTVTILLILSLCIIGFGLYVQDYYHADDKALAVLQHTGVTQEHGVTTLTPETTSDIGIIFYPGAKVESIAYLPILEKLQHLGYYCYLVDMPFRMAIFHSNAAQDVMKQHPNIKHWYIAGHSMGGAMASSYYAKHQDTLDGLILLGAYIYGDVSDQDALTIYGSFNQSVEDKIDYTQNIVEIEGGNHAQFGNYGKQKGDVDATISADEQQTQAVNAIHTFIQSRLP